MAMRTDRVVEDPEDADKFRVVPNPVPGAKRK